MRIRVFSAFLAGTLLSVGPVVAQPADLPTNPFGEEGETILVPVSLSAPLPGAYGTRWATDFSMLNHGATDALTIPVGVNCKSLRCVLPPNVTALVPGDGLYGSWLFVRKIELNDLTLQLCVRELSRDPNACVQVPLVRVSGFAPKVSITNIVASDRLRYDLRVYLLEAVSVPDGPINATISLYSITGTTPDVLLGSRMASFRLPDVLGRGISPGFLEITDLRSIVTLRAGDRLRLDVTLENPQLHLWAFLSTVDNETQRLTVLTP